MAKDEPTKTALKEVAGELGVEGTSGMNKQELAEAVVEAVQPLTTPPNVSDGAVRELKPFPPQPPQGELPPAYS